MSSGALCVRLMGWRFLVVCRAAMRSFEVEIVGYGTHLWYFVFK